MDSSRTHGRALPLCIAYSAATRRTAIAHASTADVTWMAVGAAPQQEAVTLAASTIHFVVLFYPKTTSTTSIAFASCTTTATNVAMNPFRSNPPLLPHRPGRRSHRATIVVASPSAVQDNACTHRQTWPPSYDDVVGGLVDCCRNCVRLSGCWL